MDDRVKEILSRPQSEQGTPQWFRDRQGRITSSKAAACLPRIREIAGPWHDRFKPENFVFDSQLSCSNYTSFYNFYEREVFKGKQTFKAGPAVLWGQKYEQVVTNWYQEKYDKQVNSTGLLPFPGHDWLGASPDGVTNEGTVIEIKCPKSRKIDGTPPLEYWIQIQFHLQATQLDICHYIETTIKEYMTFKEFELEQEIPESGTLIQIETIPDQLETRRYVYGPRTNSLDWLVENLQDQIDKWPDHNVVPVFFKMIVVNQVEIRRDDEWFKSALPHLESARNKIDLYKRNTRQITRELNLFK